MHESEFRRCLEQIDVVGIRRLWAHVSPHLPQPQTDEEARITIHHARTQTESLPLKLRTYSHAWLTERGFPSGLPDALRPVVVSAVGISVNFKSEMLKPAAKLIQGAMCDAVEDAYAEGRTDPAFVSQRMAEAKAREQKALGLRFARA